MNKTMLMGRITKDLEVRYANSGTAFLNFTIAVNRKFNKEGEEKKVDFLNCKSFGKTSENIQKFFAKGSMIAIIGRVETGSYEKDGRTIYTTDIMVDEFFFTGEKRGDSGQAVTTDSGFVAVDEGDSDLPF